MQKENNSGQNGKAETLTGFLNNLTEGIEEDSVSVGHIIEKFKYRGFGPLLLVPALIVVLPTGAIPLVPALAGLIIGFVCLQILIGREHPWLPKRLKEFSIPKSKLENGVERSKKYTKKIDRVLRRRLKILVNPVSTKMIAVICILLGIGMIFIGFIPMLPATLALPVLFFGLGYIAQDGVVIIAGFLSISASIIGFSYLMGS